MTMIAKLLTVFGVAAVELWAAIPAGFALGLPPILIATASTLGAAFGALMVLVLGENVRNWILRLRGQASQAEEPGYLYRIWTRFGVIGLGLLAPLLVGAPLGTAIGIALGAPAKRLMLWIIVGIMVWAALLTTAGILGLAGFQTLQH